MRAGELCAAPLSLPAQYKGGRRVFFSTHSPFRSAILMSMNIRGSPCPCSVEAIIVVDRGAPQLWKVPVYPPQLRGGSDIWGVSSIGRCVSLFFDFVRVCPPKNAASACILLGGALPSADARTQPHETSQPCPFAVDFTAFVAERGSICSSRDKDAGRQCRRQQCRRCFGRVTDTERCCSRRLKPGTRRRRPRWC